VAIAWARNTALIPPALAPETISTSTRRLMPGLADLLEQLAIDAAGASPSRAAQLARASRQISLVMPCM
jgi:hypothetical protein